MKNLEKKMRLDIKQALELSAYNGKFKKSLALVLKKLYQTNLSLSEKAYLLATAKIESDYSLQRWESDYVCGERGVPYKHQPCERAINYYESSSGKKNYFDLGTDKNGMAFFGRGLIQLTGKSNYDFYGKKIGVDLVADGDKALEKNNSFDIAVAYMKNRTFKHLPNDLTKARKSVNGGTKSLSKVNSAYFEWINILKSSEYEPLIKLPKILPNMPLKRKKQVFLTSGIVLFLGIGIFIYIKNRQNG